MELKSNLKPKWIKVQDYEQDARRLIRENICTDDDNAAHEE